MDDPNKRHHIFGDSNHNLDALVRQYGGEEAAGRAIVDAVNRAYLEGRLVLDALGRYKQTFNVGGHRVIVAGRIVNNGVRLGSAWIRPVANGDDDV